MSLAVIREMVQKLPQWISSVGRGGWQKIGAVALTVFAAAGACVYLRKRFAAKSLPATLKPSLELPFRIGSEVRYIGKTDPFGRVTSIDMKTNNCTVSTQYGPKTVSFDKLELYVPVKKEPLQIDDRVLYKGFMVAGKSGQTGTIVTLHGPSWCAVRFGNEKEIYQIPSGNLTKVV
jgi:hypothetical protein